MANTEPSNYDLRGTWPRRVRALVLAFVVLLFSAVYLGVTLVAGLQAVAQIQGDRIDSWALMGYLVLAVLAARERSTSPELLHAWPAVR